MRPFSALATLTLVHAREGRELCKLHLVVRVTAGRNGKRANTDR